MKKLLVILLLLLVSACGTPTQEPENLKVVATLFPQYDFVREIAGEFATVTLLLPPGAESHSYEPTPSDLIALEGADLVFYTGEEMEPWIPRVLHGDHVVDTTARIERHDHDPHVWTSPQNAILMVETVADALCAADPEHASVYRENAAAYLETLRALDVKIADTVTASARKTLILGDRNAMHYFLDAYGLTCYSAYDSCGHESEPAASAVASLIDRVKTEKIPVVYHEELVDPKVARLIADESGAALLLLHSCHNVTAEELADGVSYLGLMEQNLAHLKKGLN